MPTLTPEASDLYYEGVMVTYDYGFASYAETLRRLAFLRRYTPSESMRSWLGWLPDEIQEPEGEPSSDDNVSVVVTHGDTSEIATDDAGDTDEVSTAEMSRRISAPRMPPLFFHFTINGVPGAKRWDFHNQDKDFFPSIPHGHEKRSIRKLDVYRRGIYIHGTEVDRESPHVTVALWNSADFRAYARREIMWYAAFNPNFVWRVRRDRILRLPRPRRA
jgi:hypothetical protein